MKTQAELYKLKGFLESLDDHSHRLFLVKHDMLEVVRCAIAWQEESVRLKAENAQLQADVVGV